MRLLLRCILSVMLISLLPSRISSAEGLNLKPALPTARQYDEAFVTCVEENMICHETLRAVVRAPAFDWQEFFLTAAAGIVSGMVLEAQLHR